MLSSRFAGIPISSSTIDGRGVPRLLIRGEGTPSAKPARVAGFISEWRPASNRNGGRLQFGIGGRIASEFAWAAKNAPNVVIAIDFSTAAGSTLESGPGTRELAL